MELFKNLMVKATKVAGKGGLALKSASPEILLAVGISGIVVSAVLACRATLRAHEVIEARNENYAKIQEAWEKVESGEISTEVYSEKDKQRDILKTYLNTGVGFVKLYGPSVTLGVVSIACIISGHRIMKARNVALMAAYQAIEKGFAAYRKRVVEEFGEEKDYMFKNGIREETVTETITDEKGKTKKVTSKKLTVDPNGLSIYARFFDDSNPQWEKNPDYNMMFLKTQQAYFNNLLQARGHVFLNEVYEALGIERTEAGAIVGWHINADGDNYIDFGLYDGDRPKVRDFVNGKENAILLDFNVDGVIYHFLKKQKGLTS